MKTNSGKADDSLFYLILTALKLSVVSLMMMAAGITLSFASETVGKATLISEERVSPDDSVAPETFVNIPIKDYTAGRTTVFKGNATDVGGSGIAQVRVAIRQSSTDLWFNFTEKVFGPIRDASGRLVGIRDAELSDSTPKYTNWSVTITLPDGEYEFFVLAVDSAGNSQYSGKGVWPVSVPFSVR